MGRLGAVLARLGGVLEASWAVLDASYVVLADEIRGGWMGSADMRGDAILLRPNRSVDAMQDNLTSHFPSKEI